MSTGYNVLFDPYKGTLYGRFPAGPVFVSVFLALADQQGVVDESLQAISGRTGWPMDLLTRAIDELMQPDPESRSKDFDGKRLVLIDENRKWGWRVVNHQVYRDKARLMSKSARERDTGSNASRMRDRRRPPVTAGDRLSYSNTNTNSERTPLPPEDRGEGGVDDEVVLDTEPDAAPHRDIPEDVPLHVQAAVLLRNDAVICNVDHPTLLAWERDEFTLDQIHGALREARRYKPRPQSLRPQYIDAVMRNLARAPPEPRKTRFERAGDELAAATMGGDDDDTS
jgi:hypothetical protein